MGLYDGAGTLYGESGGMLYQGQFLLGKYHGQGILYREETGEIILEGEFRNGTLVTPKEEAWETIQLLQMWGRGL